MNIFKISYKVVRENSDEIYKGFGFKHHSDATQYYVHPDNQSFKGTTTLCQPIGESITLFSLLLSSIIKSENSVLGDCYISEDNSATYVHIDIPDDFRENQIVQNNIYSYKAYFCEEELTISAYDMYGRWIDGDMIHLRPLYKLLPAFCVLLYHEMQMNTDFNTMILDYIDNPTADIFVNIHEDFYQEHKMDEYHVVYSDLSAIDSESMISFASSYQVIKENIQEANNQELVKVISFDANEFTIEQKEFIPNLSKEFVLPTVLNSVCSAVTSGDARAILLHGPAGTGKTISCKLICQTIGLPILETVNCTENLDEFVLGKFVPEEDKIIFKESYVTKAIKEGGAIVFEEINFAKPQYLAFLNSLLDDNGFVRLDTGEIVKRHENFRFFATMNLGYFGTKELNQSLYNRFNIIGEIAELSDEAITRMLVARVPECKAFIDKILGVYHKLKNKIAQEELDVVISPRNLENWAKLAKYEGYIVAAEKTIIPIAKCDRILEQTIRGMVMLYKWK